MHPSLSEYIPHTLVTGTTSIEMTHAVAVISTQLTWSHFVRSVSFCMVQNGPVLIKSWACALDMNPKRAWICRVVCEG